MTKPIQPVGSTVQKPEPVGGARPEDIWAIEDGLAMPLSDAIKLKIAKAGSVPSRDGMRPATRPIRSAGLRSTEFWLCAFCAALGTLLCFRWPLPEGLAGAMLVGLAAASYAHSRGRVKGRPYVQGKL